MSKSSHLNRATECTMIDVRSAIDTNSKARERLLKACKPCCRCHCHRRRSFELSSSMIGWLGSFKFVWANLWWRQNCDVRSCQGSESSSWVLHLNLPPVLGTMVIAWYSGSTLFGPKLSVQVIQLVRSKVYSLALLGDVEGIRWLYVEGRASINQAHPFDGACALIVRFD